MKLLYSCVLLQLKCSDDCVKQCSIPSWLFIGFQVSDVIRECTFWIPFVILVTLFLMHFQIVHPRNKTKSRQHLVFICAILHLMLWQRMKLITFIFNHSPVNRGALNFYWPSVSMKIWSSLWSYCQSIYLEPRVLNANLKMWDLFSTC